MARNKPAIAARGSSSVDTVLNTVAAGEGGGDGQVDLALPYIAPTAAVRVDPTQHRPGGRFDVDEMFENEPDSVPVRGDAGRAALR